MPTKKSSSLGRGSRRSRGKNYEQHKRSKTTPKSSTLTQVPAEEQGLRRILGSGKVVHMETTEWWKDSCRHFLSLVMSYKLQFSLQHISENPQSADPDFLLTDGNIWTEKYHPFYKIIPQMQEKIKTSILGRMMQKSRHEWNIQTPSLLSGFWLTTSTVLHRPIVILGTKLRNSLPQLSLVNLSSAQAETSLNIKEGLWTAYGWREVDQQIGLSFTNESKILLEQCIVLFL